MTEILIFDFRNDDWYEKSLGVGVRFSRIVLQGVAVRGLTLRWPSSLHRLTHLHTVAALRPVSRAISLYVMPLTHIRSMFIFSGNWVVFLIFRFFIIYVKRWSISVTTKKKKNRISSSWNLLQNLYIMHSKAKCNSKKDWVKQYTIHIKRRERSHWKACMKQCWCRPFFIGVKPGWLTWEI